MKFEFMSHLAAIQNAAWVTEWEMPFEGGFTLLSKFGWANAVDGGQLCKAVFGKKLLDANNVRCHGRSMLDTGWVSGGNPSIPYLRDRVVQGALVSRAGRWTRHIADDHLLRFCPTCLAKGFQSAIYQIDGLRTCPIHDEPFRSACMQCGFPGVRYAISTAGFSAAFHCPKCMAPLAGKFDPEIWTDKDLRRSAFTHLAPVASWLMRLANAHVNWSSWSSWYDAPHRNFSQAMRRSGALMVLANVVPPPREVEALLQRRSAPQVYPGGLKNGSELTPLHPQLPTPEVIRERVTVYKAVRRYVLRRLRGCSRLAIRSLADEITVLHGSWAMSLSTRDCPRMQSFLLWRFHFEAGQRDARKLVLRTSALQWPSDGEIDAKGWAAYCLASFYAASEVFDSWRSEAIMLVDADPLGGDRNNARALHAQFEPFLAPSILSTFPAVSSLNCTDAGASERILVIGPAAMPPTVSIPGDKGLWCACKKRGSPTSSVMRKGCAARSMDRRL